MAILGLVVLIRRGIGPTPTDWDEPDIRSVRQILLSQPEPADTREAQRMGYVGSQCAFCRSRRVMRAHEAVWPGGLECATCGELWGGTENSHLNQW